MATFRLLAPTPDDIRRLVTRPNPPYLWWEGPYLCWEELNGGSPRVD